MAGAGVNVQLFGRFRHRAKLVRQVNFMDNCSWTGRVPNQHLSSSSLRPLLYVNSRVAEPHPLNADPDPAFHFNAEPDPAFHFIADPDPTPAPLQGDANLRPLVNRPFRALF
jgi:hypothetical protein